ncbi:hypothetical protein P4S53_18320 [Photobacterium sp. Hal280]
MTGDEYRNGIHILSQCHRLMGLFIAKLDSQFLTGACFAIGDGLDSLPDLMLKSCAIGR